jgi:hypothetical protein
MTPEQGTPSAVETLQAAARLMRERAQGAVSAPWTWFVTVDRRWAVVTGQAHVAQCADDDDADYIASWHPAVALAVADWLENVSAWIDEGLGRCDDLYQTNYPDAWNDQRRAALTVARAYLGGQP